MLEELRALEKNQTWDLVKLPKTACYEPTICTTLLVISLETLWKGPTNSKNHRAERGKSKVKLWQRVWPHIVFFPGWGVRYPLSYLSYFHVLAFYLQIPSRPVSLSNWLRGPTSFIKLESFPSTLNGAGIRFSNQLFTRKYKFLLFDHPRLAPFASLQWLSF